jgi:hypothetical protein
MRQDARDDRRLFDTGNDLELAKKFFTADRFPGQLR